MPERDAADAVRSTIDAWNRGDVDAWVETTHPDIEFRTSGLYPGLERVYRGRSGLRNFWRDFRDPWQSLHIAIEGIREVGDRVLTLYILEGRAREGMTVRREAAGVWRVADGLVVEVETYASWKEGLDDVGLDA